jgi:hypothetical protein
MEKADHHQINKTVTVLIPLIVLAMTAMTIEYEGSSSNLSVPSSRPSRPAWCTQQHQPAEPPGSSCAEWLVTFLRQTAGFGMPMWEAGRDAEREFSTEMTKKDQT